MSSKVHSKPLIDALSGLKPERTPIWFMRQAGRCLPEYRKIKETMNTYDMFQDPIIASTITLQPLKRFDYDAAIVYADILHIADVLGCGLSFEAGVGPKMQNPTQTKEDVLRVEKAFANLEQCLYKLSFVLETLSRVKTHLTSSQTLIGFAGSPWSVACYMIAGKSPGQCQEVKLWMLQNKELFHTLMQILTLLTIQYLIGQIHAGAEVIQIFESHAGMSLSVQQYETFCLPYIIQISRALKHQSPNTPVVYYVNDSASKLPSIHNSLLPATIAGFGVDHRQPLSHASQISSLQEKTLQGNLDPLALYGDPKDLYEEVENILEQGQRHPGGFVFNVGHGLTPNTPLAAIEAVIKQVHT